MKQCAAFWDMTSWRAWAETHYRPAIDEADRSLFEKAAHECDLIPPDGDLGDIATDEEAQVALLLSRVVNVEELSLTLPAIHSDRLLLQRMRALVDHRTGLQHLHTFSPSYYNFEGHVEGGFELTPISTVFRLPSIRKIVGTACLEPEDDAFRGFDCPPGSSTVTNIEFYRSSICPKAFRVMIEACKGLEVLYCDWGGHTVGWSEINFSIIGGALQSQAHSLQKLTLDCRKHYDVWPEDEEVLIGPLGSLKNFKQLRMINVPGVALIGWDKDRIDGFNTLPDVLPPCIEELRISNWAPGLEEQLSMLSAVTKEQYPNLRRLILQDVEAGSLQQQFDDANAHVSVIIEDGDEWDHFS
ncbi:hypothetical protein LTS18_007460 [Coniosporium uncinatum]|uniref:Uncharacterized protein n=1 Tax=Coniosporium uncinatum TaxID=93489 RepID=A0ACC3DNZ6_9PEZI|nr:hypothetical protein LTS18_007460 [Coniosporium uncinatum]